MNQRSRAGTLDPETTPRRSVSAIDAMLALLILSIGLGAWLSLGMAHLGWHRTWLVVLTTTALTVLAYLWVFMGKSLRIAVTSSIALAALALVSAVMFFPGHPYGAGDKDPGVYLAHGSIIERTGSFDIEDPVLEEDRIPLFQVISPGARFPGIWFADRSQPRIVPQFFHLYPATLATAEGLAGRAGAINLSPVFGLLSVLAVAAAVRSVFGNLAGIISGALLATNMLQVWFAKYPSTEMMTQFLISGAILWGVLAIKEDWRRALVPSGLLASLTLLARPDGILIVLLGFGLIALGIALHMNLPNALWFGVGLSLPLPHGLYQAFGPAGPYAAAVGFPRWQVLVAVCLAVGVLAVATRNLIGGFLWHLWGPFRDFLASSRSSWVIMIAGGLGSGGLLFLAAIRPYVFGQDMMEFHGRTIRSLDEINLHRLAFFITWPGFGIMWSGFCVALYKHRKQLAALLLFPGVLLFPIYLWHARVSARLMWWGRRFIPVVLTVVVVLIAVALAEGMIYRGKMKVAVNSVALASTLLLIAAFGQMSWPLRGHAEYGGSYEIVDRIANVAGDEDGVFLWEFPDDHTRAAYLFGGPLWLTSGQVSVLLEKQPSQRYVETFMEGFPGRRVFVVAEGDTLPDGLSVGDFTRVDEFSQSLTVWEETTHERPSRNTVSDFHISVWELTG